MIPYPLPDAPSEPMEISKRRGNYSKFPLDVALTPFHLAMVFYDRLRIVCTVNQQLVYEDTYDQVERLYLKKAANQSLNESNSYFIQSFGDLRGLTCDGRSKKNPGPILWSFADYALFRYTVSDESRHIWQVYSLDPYLCKREISQSIFQNRSTWSKSNLNWRCNFAATTAANDRKFSYSKRIIFSANTST